MLRTIKALSTVKLFNTQYFNAIIKISQGRFCRSVVTNLEFWKGNLNAPVRENPIVMKLDSPEYKAILTDEVKQLHKMFTDHGFEIRIAGGAVRDLVLGKQPKDLDFATTATPDEMKEMFNKLNVRMFNERGEKHGTVSVRLNDKENFEITTLRIDISTDGRHAVVHFTKDWLLDANRRDLTINSMFLDLDGTVYDYFNGYEDLKKRRVVFVGDANKRITEDYLRILRYFRFYGRIADKPDNHDQDTLEALKRHASGLQQISGERIWSELSLILTGNFAGELLLLIIKLGLGPYIGFPEKCNLDELKKVWDRLKLNHFKVNAVTLICAAIDTVEAFDNFKNRAKVSAFERELGFFLIENMEYKIHEVPLRPYQALVINSKRNLTHTIAYIKELFKYRGDVNLLEEFEKWQVPKFPVTGYMLLEKGVGGKVTGIAMQKLKDIWIESNFELTAEQLLKQLPNVVESLDLTLVTKPKSREKVNSK